MKKLVFTLILLLCLFFSGQAQSAKVKEKATEKVEELNNQITIVDKALALSDEQKAKTHQIHVERIMAVRKAKKAGVSEENKKAVQKKYFKNIYNEVLTKEQRKARKIGKERIKE